MSRPLIAIPARLAAKATGLRYAAEVVAGALAEAVWDAGGEPVTIHPVSSSQTQARLSAFAGLVLPGGADLAPRRYGALLAHPAVYDVNEAQDEFDLAVAAAALKSSTPMLAICRGLHVVNTLLGGTLCQHMGDPPLGHCPLVHRVTTALAGSLGEITAGRSLSVSCHHHQCVDSLGRRLRATATAADGTIEAAEIEGASTWSLAVQWHPEDTAHADPMQRALFGTLVFESAKGRRSALRRR